MNPTVLYKNIDYWLSKFVHDNWFWLSIIYIFVKDTTLETLNSCLSTLCLCVFIYTIFHIIITCFLLCKSLKKLIEPKVWHIMVCCSVWLTFHCTNVLDLFPPETSYFSERCPRKKKIPQPSCVKCIKGILHKDWTATEYKCRLFTRTGWLQPF